MSGTPVCFVVPAYNAATTLPQCLDAILVATRGNGLAEVVVVDHGSTDGTPDLVDRAYGSLVRLLRCRGGGVGRVRNVGARATAAPLLAFVDADVVIAPDYLPRATAALTRWRADAIGSFYGLPPDARWIERAWHRLHAPPPDGPVAYLNAGNFVIRRDAFDAVGGFDEGLPSGEDAELGARLRALGFVIVQDHSVAGIHLGNPRTLVAFFRQQYWHGLGALGTARLERVDRPLLMTLCHVLLSVLGLAMTAWTFPSSVPVALGAAFGSGLAVPAVTVLYRARTRHGRPPVLAGMLLYWLYYWSRAFALLTILLRLPFRARGRR